MSLADLVSEPWSIMGNAFTKARNQLGLDKGRKIASIRCNRVGVKPQAQDEEVCLTYLDFEE